MSDIPNNLIGVSVFSIFDREEYNDLLEQKDRTRNVVPTKVIRALYQNKDGQLMAIVQDWKKHTMATYFLHQLVCYHPTMDKNAK